MCRACCELLFITLAAPAVLMLLVLCCPLQLASHVSHVYSRAAHGFLWDAAWPGCFIYRCQQARLTSAALETLLPGLAGSQREAPTSSSAQCIEPGQQGERRVLSSQQLAVVGWSLMRLSQTPPAPWQQAFCAALATRAHSIRKGAHLVMACATLDAMTRGHNRRQDVLFHRSLRRGAGARESQDHFALRDLLQAAVRQCGRVLCALAATRSTSPGELAACGIHLARAGWCPLQGDWSLLQVWQQLCASIIAMRYSSP
jgi:hypothetical protein